MLVCISVILVLCFFLFLVYIVCSRYVSLPDLANKDVHYILTELFSRSAPEKYLGSAHPSSIAERSCQRVWRWVGQHCIGEFYQLVLRRQLYDAATEELFVNAHCTGVRLDDNTIILW